MTARHFFALLFSLMTLFQAGMAGAWLVTSGWSMWAAQALSGVAVFGVVTLALAGFIPAPPGAACDDGNPCTTDAEVITHVRSDSDDLRANSSAQVITPPAAQPATMIARDLHNLHAAKAGLPATPCDDGNPCTKED